MKPIFAKFSHMLLVLLMFATFFSPLLAQVKAPSPGSLAAKHPAVKIAFPSTDGLMVTGHLYEVDPNKPVILLCHQARFNKQEYADIAPKLNQHGYNCLAIDQRSGGFFADQSNETCERAKQQGITVLSYIHAEPDIIAAINFLHQKYNKKITIWGSSYSSSLALLIAESNDQVKAVLAFSPGDYFGDKKPGLSTVIPKLTVPFFITSSKEEAPKLKSILSGVTLSASKVHFIPEGEGMHGSKALWNGQQNAGEYWEAVRDFLREVCGK